MYTRWCPNAMFVLCFIVFVGIAPTTVLSAEIIFKRQQIDSVFRSEGVAVADFNGDGRLDIAAGNVYYAGPDWKMHPMLGAPKEFKVKGYSDAFLCFADDINGDDRVDLVVVGPPGGRTHWLENPGKQNTVWKEHLAIAPTGNESPWHLDIDSDGRRELIYGNRPMCARPGADAAQLWIKTSMAKGGRGDAHGLGVGDVDGDGRLDVLNRSGWWEQPDDHKQVLWTFHPAEFRGGAQLQVYDFDGDGDNDVLGSSPHDYGIWWCEQTPDGWKQHEVDKSISQTHALHLADIDGDGLMDFVTGKRYWAHNGGDPGSAEPAVLCWFKLRREDGRPVWTKHQIDDDSGAGLHFEIVDLNGDGLLDIATSNKKGVYVFIQRRSE